MGEHAIHPVAALFPEMTPEELHELAEDIRASGLAHPIVRDRNGTILDGLNRLRACELAGVEPRFEIFEGEDPIAFIVSSNLKRRHLNESQRAMVGSGLANMAHGGDRRSDEATQARQDGGRPIAKAAANLPLEKLTQAAVAATLNVSERSVRHAGIVRKRGSPDLILAVEQGKVSVSAAAKQVMPPKPRHRPKDAIDIAPIKSAFELVQSAADRGDIQRFRQHLRKLQEAVVEALK
jgi:hypothetical protein